MNPELYILIFSIVLAVVLLFLFVPKIKVIDAHVSFLFMQAQSWLYGTLVSQFHLIIYPVRLIDRGYIANFSFEYVVFPTISVLYNLYFPRSKSLLVKVVYMVLSPAIITVLELWLEKNTNLIEYTNWAWYWSWITMFITLNIAYFYYRWFMKRIKKRNF